MNGEEEYRVRLIADTPALEDEFSVGERQGAHKRVADAIVDLIVTEEGGLSIGLEGGWGSGKSTVVNLVKERIEERKVHKNFAVILFDAWAHQGDPLRRTFLETLIRHLSEAPLKWVDEVRWSRKREELAQRRKITETKNIPRLGKLGSLLALAVLLIPAGLALLNAGLRDSTPDWFVVAGFVITVIPVVLLLISLVPGGLAWVWKRIRGDKSSVAVGFSDWGALLAQRYVTDTRTETIENPNPTSVEFEEIFTGLMKEALEEQDRHLLIALDNLDRVTSTDALSILAALQTFLQHSEHHRAEWFKKLYVLIPYDPGSLKKLWDKQDDGENNRVASAFLDKVFQVRFEVTPLLLSDWREYLIKLLGEALPDHDDAEFHATYRVATEELKRNGGRISPTPRDLKLFVNQIGTITRQWQDTFPLPVVAYYVLLRRRVEDTDVPAGLLDKSLPNKEFAGLLGDDPEGNLAAIAFNVSIPEARQLLLRTPLENALGAGDVERIKELAEHRGFRDVLHDIPFSEWAESEGAKIASAAYALDESGVLESAERAVRSMIVGSLSDAASLVETWTPIDHDRALDIGAIIRLSPKPVLARKIIAGVSSGLTQDNNGDLGTPNWVEGLIKLLEIIDEQGLAEAYSAKGVIVPGNPDGYIEVCAQLHDMDAEGKYWPHIRSQSKIAQVVDALGAVAATDSFSATHVGAIRVLKAGAQTPPWSMLSAKIVERLQTQGAAYPPPIVTAYLQAMWELRDADEAIDTELSNLATQGHVLHHLHHTKKDAGAAAWGVFIYLQKVHAASAPAASPGNAQDGFNYMTNELFANPGGHETVTEKFVGLVAEAEDYGLLLSVLDAAAAAKSWLVACIKLVLAQGGGVQLFTPEHLLERRAFLKAELSDKEYDQLVADLIGKAKLIEHVRSREFLLDEAEVYVAIVQNDGATTGEFVKWCQDGLNSLSAAQWEPGLKGEGAVVDLLLALRGKGVKVKLGTAYQDAMTAHGKLLMSGKIKLNRLREQWSELFEPLDADARKVMRDELLHAAVAPDNTIRPEFFDLYGDELADIQTLRSESGVVLHLFVPLVTNRNTKGLVWIGNILQAHSDFLGSYDKTHVKKFEERVQSAIDDDPGDEASAPIATIAGALGIEPTPVEAEDAEKEEEEVDAE